MENARKNDRDLKSISMERLLDILEEETDAVEKSASLFCGTIIKILVDFLNADPTDDRFDAIHTLFDAIYKIKVDFICDEDAGALKEAWHRLNDSEKKTREVVDELQMRQIDTYSEERE